MIVLNLTIENF